MKSISSEEMNYQIENHNLYVETSGENGKRIELAEFYIRDYSFNNCNFESIVAANSRFEYCLFNNVDLYDSILSHSIFENCKFTNCMLSQASLYGTKFISSIFINCNFVKCQARDTEINDCVIYKCNLKLFDIEKSLIKNSKFIENDFADKLQELHKRNGNIIW